MITVGHDAEVFLKTRAGVFVSAEGLVGGTKEKPRPINKGALQEDNVMAELNIEPAIDRDEFSSNTKTVMDGLRTIIKPHKLVIHQGTSAEFKDEELSTNQARTFGCLPDYDAWDVCENPIVDLTDSNMRFAGGHIHIGVDYHDDAMAMVRLVRRLDLTLGVGMRLLFGTSPRQLTYGKWGAHRPTAYGVEYRVPDNNWLFKPSHRRWVFDIVHQMAHSAYRTQIDSVTRDDLIALGDDKDNLHDMYRNHSPVNLPAV